jgi:hypothetical protein
MTKRILALDIATTTGYACGPVGKIERSGSVRLKTPKDDVWVAGQNIGFFLRDLFIIQSEIPDVIVVEAPLPAGASPGAAAAIIAWGSLFTVQFMAAAYEIPVRLVKADDVRSHYTGRSRWQAPPGSKGGKDANRIYGKSKVVERAHLLGHMPLDSHDNDRADACAVHSYASVKLFGHRETELRMFGERPSAA